MNNDEKPCNDCDKSEFCDGWEARFCCELCNWIYEGNTPCDDCDPMDL